MLPQPLLSKLPSRGEQYPAIAPATGISRHRFTGDSKSALYHKRYRIPELQPTESDQGRSAFPQDKAIKKLSDLDLREVWKMDDADPGLQSSPESVDYPLCLQGPCLTWATIYTVTGTPSL